MTNVSGCKCHIMSKSWQYSLPPLCCFSFYEVKIKCWEYILTARYTTFNLTFQEEIKYKWILGNSSRVKKNKRNTYIIWYKVCMRITFITGIANCLFLSWCSCWLFISSQGVSLSLSDASTGSCRGSQSYSHWASPAISAIRVLPSPHSRGNLISKQWCAEMRRSNRFKCNLNRWLSGRAKLRRREQNWSLAKICGFWVAWRGFEKFLWIGLKRGGSCDGFNIDWVRPKLQQ